MKPPFWARDPPSLANEPLIGVPEPQREVSIPSSENVIQPNGTNGPPNGGDLYDPDV